MLKIQFLLLVLYVGGLEAWLWWSDPNQTKTPAETTSAPTAAESAGNSTPSSAKKKEDLAGVGAEIMNLASGIRKFVNTWDTTPTTWTSNGGLENANNNMTGNMNRSIGERAEEGYGIGSGDGAGSGSGSRADSGSGSGIESVSGTVEGSGITIEPDVESGVVMPTNLTGIVDDVSNITGTVDGVLKSTLTPPVSPINQSDSACLPVPSDWPICSGKRSKYFMLPNFFNHTSVEEVGVVLQEWAWLLRAGCHHGTEWFLCLLLAPRCPTPNTTAPTPLPAQSPTAHPYLPCRSFCHVLQDSCWASLENGRLPVECHLLPDREPGHPPCVSVSNQKGNPGGLECILCGDTF